MRSTTTSPQPVASAPTLQIWLILVAVIAVKVAFVFGQMPSMWIWADEMLYSATGYDLVHWGDDGVPHSRFLFYPPLTSLLVAPIHLVDLAPEVAYPAMLAILAVTHALGALGIFFLVGEVFGLRSRALLLLLLLGPPSYMALALMSETLFVALFGWLLYFWVRYLRGGGTRFAVFAGVVFLAMMLTRKTAVGLLVSVAVSLVVAWLAGSRTGRSRRDLLLGHGAFVVTALAGNALWNLFRESVLAAEYGYHGMKGYVTHGLLPALASTDTTLLLARKMVANLGYVSLATFGLCLPILLWFLVRRWRSSDERDWVVRQCLVFVVTFMLFAAFAAAVHMFINRGSGNPRYFMYGRYVEYFAPVLIGLTFGLVASGLRWSRRDRVVVLALAAVLAVVPVFAVPASFFPLMLSKQAIAPNCMSISWLFGLGVESRAGAALVTLVLALAGTWALTRAGSERRDRASSPAAATVAACLALMLVGTVDAGRRAARKSQLIDEEYGAYSRYVSTHPEQFREGLFLDLWEPKGKRRHRDRLVMNKTLAEHLDVARMGRNPSPHLGERPVLSRRPIPGYEILFAGPDDRLVIYSTTESAEPRLSRKERKKRRRAARAAAQAAAAGDDAQR